MTQIFVGLMSGTSMDGVDAVVVEFLDQRVKLHATHSHPYPDILRNALLEAIRQPLTEPIDQDGELSSEAGTIFADAALAVIRKSDIAPDSIRAIGSHGQTLRHQPNIEKPFSLQIGDADVISRRTGITTIANFRNADIAVGGQGAPLVPPFHNWLFSADDKTRIVANIGGIANITILSKNEVLGFDTGPGNGLMDRWIQKNLDVPFDCDGAWAARGQVIPALLESFLADRYFELAPPKSTGFEHFNEAWLKNFDLGSYATCDVQATLSELTAATIAIGTAAHSGDIDDLFVCGGGVHNAHLLKRLQHYLPRTHVGSTAELGLHPDWVEAVAFAWLAARKLAGETGNLPTVTGASHKVQLGDIHSP